MYRPPMEYQYIIDDGQNGEFVFFVIQNYKLHNKKVGFFYS